MSVPESDIAARLLAELGWVQRLARQLVGDGADDLAQDVAALALESGPRPSGLRAWLGAVTRRRAARWHRNRLRRREVERSRAPQPSGDDPAAVVIRLQQQRQLAQAVLELTEPYRSVIVARFFDGLSPLEISRRRLVSAAAVRQQIHRGLATLRARLERAFGPDWRAAAIGLVLPRTEHAAVLLGGLMITKKVLLAAGGVAAALLVALWVVWPAGTDRLQENPWPVGSRVTAEALDAGAPAAEEPASRLRIAVTESGPFQLEVVTDGGQPVPDAHVLLLSRGSVRSGRTDATGRAEFEPEPSAGSVLVLPGDRPPIFEQLKAIEGHKRLVLPDGAQVSGLVYVFDRPLSAPVRLELRGGSKVPFLESELPDSLTAELAKQRLDVRRLAVRTDLSGAFSFRGLPQTWSGVLQLQFGEPYWIRPRETSLKVTAKQRAAVPQPTEGVILSLTRLPAVRGRVVWKDGRPAEGAQIRVIASFEGGESSPMIIRRVDADGRFEVGLTTGRPTDYEAWLDPDNHLGVEELRVTWSHPDAKKGNRRDVPASRFEAIRDLGSLVLYRAPTLHVLVQDREGAPIAGARLEGKRMQSPTDEDGRGMLQVEDVGQRTFRIGAPGCLVARYNAEAGTGTEPDPLRFTVRAGNRLTVKVSSSELKYEELRLEVHSSEPPFTAAGRELWRPSPMHVVAGSTVSRRASFRTDHSSGEAFFELDDAGRVELCSIVPGLPVRLRVLDPISHVVVERTIRLPNAGREELLELRTNDRVSTILGTVVLEGLPLPGARVVLWGDKKGANRRTGHDGTFLIRLLATQEPVRVVVDHPDSPTLRTKVMLLPGKQRPRFVLSRAYEIDVRVLDTSGAPVDATVTLADWRDGGDRSNLGPGHVRFRRLPGGSMLVRASVAGRTFERRVNPETQPTLEVRVPALTTVRLRLPPGLLTDHLVLQLEDAEGQGLKFRQELRLIEGRWTPSQLRMFPGTYRVSCGPEGTAETPPWTAEWIIDAGDDVEKSVFH